MTLSDFGRRLDALIHERCRSAARFCELVKKHGGEISEGNLSRIIHGERRPPLESIDAWASALGIDDADEIEELKIAAELTYLPAEAVVRRALRELADQTEADAKRIERLTIELDALRGVIRPQAPGRKPPSSR